MRTWLLAAALTASLALVPMSAGADGTGSYPASGAPVDADAQRLSQLGHSVKSNLVPAGKSDRYGHAEVLINAPLAKVRQQVTDYAHYKDLVPEKFHNARVVDKNKEQGTTDLYFTLDIMKGLVKLTNQIRFAPPRSAGPSTEIIEGRFIKGTNVKDSNVILTLHQVTPEFTVLKIDLLILPTIPAPQAAIDEELRDAALMAADALHDRAQGHNRTVPLNATSSTASAQ
jgi:hypothetical protein